jgi:Sigma-70 region 2
MKDLETLAAEARSGNRQSLERLVVQIQRPVYNLALRMLWHPEDTRDASQEILVRVVTHLSSFRGKRASWAFPQRRSASGCRGRERRSWDSLELIVVSSTPTTRVAAYGDCRARKGADESTLQRHSLGGPSPPGRFQASSIESDASKQSSELPRSTERCPRQILGRNCSKRFTRPSVPSMLPLMRQPCARTMTAIGAVTRMHLFTVEASAALV